MSGHRFGWPAVIVARECGGTDLAAQGSDEKVRLSDQPEQDQGKRRGRRLHVEDPAADRCRAIDAGHDHAEQKENLDLEREGRDWRCGRSPDVGLVGRSLYQASLRGLAKASSGVGAFKRFLNIRTQTAGVISRCLRFVNKLSWQRHF